MVLTQTNECSADTLSYLIVSTHPIILSDFIETETESNGCMVNVTPTSLDTQLIHQADIIIIVDDGFDEQSYTRVSNELKHASEKFTIVTSDETDHSRWSHLGYCTVKHANGGTLDFLVNTIIESIEMPSICALDHYELKEQFANASLSWMYKGVASGESRSIRSIDDAAPAPNLDLKTLTLMMFGDINTSVSEWETAMSHLQSKYPTVKLVGSLRVLPPDLSSNSVQSIIFANT